MPRESIRNRGASVKKKSRVKRVLIIGGIALLACLAVTFIYIQSKFATLNQEIPVDNFTMPMETEEPAPTNIPEADPNELSQLQEEANLPEELYYNSKAINILLLGLDTRNPKQFTGGRTDTIIIMTLDTINKQIKLTSIMRDTLISIPGHDMNRINTVYGFNGPEAAMEAVQKYFGVQIDYYAVVNFWAFANIIDSVGGVQVDVKSSEIENLNLNLEEINLYNTDKDSSKVKKSGKQKLDGKQAVAYMRIRHVGEADFRRTERQRNVLEAIVKKDFSLAEIIKLADGLPNNMRTNVGQLEMASLANTAFGLKGAPIKQMRLPADDSFKFGSYKGMSILVVDFKKSAQALKEFLQQKQ